MQHPFNSQSVGLPNHCFAESRVFDQFATRKLHGWNQTTPSAEKTSAVSLPEANGQLESRDSAMQRVEAVLMLSREPLPSRKLAQLASLEDGTQARTLLRKLNQFYDRVGRAFRVEEVAGGFQLLTRQKFASWLRRLGHVPPELRLSSPALETLAVVAYRQPVLKADIEAIRGVHCNELLRQLMERDLVRIAGRSEELGRPYLYTVTKRFLQLFGIRSLEDLPQAELIRSAPVPPVPKVASSGHHMISNSVHSHSPRSSDEKESDVSVTISSRLANEQDLDRKFGAALVPDVRLEDEDDDFEDDDLDDEDDDDDDFDDEDDDLDDEDDDFDDEEDDDFEDDEEDDFDDEDLDDEDDEWEEVDDEEEDDDFDDDEDDDDFDDDEDEDLDEEDD
jgi:segregation and condensation protein B